jgi:hypothetical protein
MKYIIIFLLILFLGFILLMNKKELFDTFKSKCEFENELLGVEQCLDQYSKDTFNNFKECIKTNNGSRKVFNNINALNFLSLISNSSCENIKNTIESIHARE